MTVSIIVPAYNAASTIGDTLVSIIAQSHRDWEAIVVDDGSEDDTVGVVREFCAREPRIHLIEERHGGVSAARNRGIDAATGEWLLFLDADDLILETHLERLLARLAEEPRLDAVISSWARLTPQGQQIEANQMTAPRDAFLAFAHHSLFPIHCCLIRRTLVLAVGGWDTSLVTCEDWDLWLRVARTGARFGAVPDVTALYRMRTTSASLDGNQMAQDGLRILDVACMEDPRVREPDPRYARGLPKSSLASQRYYFLSWCAGLELGKGREAVLLLRQLDRHPGIDLESAVVAEVLMSAIPLGGAAIPGNWSMLWEKRHYAIDRFLHALEEHTQIAGISAETRTRLEGLILMCAIEQRPAVMGKTFALAIDAEQPLQDCDVPLEVERALCDVSWGGRTLGTLELPVFDGLLSGDVVRDAIAAEFGWQLLEQFFQETLYPLLEVRVVESKRSIWRGPVCLLDDMADDEDWKVLLFQQAGWTLFLQELWGLSEWPLEGFYNPEWPQEGISKTGDGQDSLIVEIAGPLPSIASHEPTIGVVVQVGGKAIGTVELDTIDGAIEPQKLRVAINQAAGFELCRSAVREALVGCGSPAAGTLRERLVQAAQSAPDGCQPEESTLIFGRLSPEAIDSPLSRRAALASGAHVDLLEASILFDQPVLASGAPGTQPLRLFYRPECGVRPACATRPAGLSPSIPEPGATEPAPPYGREHFESLFANGPDPWVYGQSKYERIKYEQTLQLLPDRPIRHALEVGCAEGYFTRQLAPRVEKLVAADISQIALDRAAQRCGGFDNVDYVGLDITQEAIPGLFDLIVCSEVLYYVGGGEQLGQVAARLTKALKPGGHLLMAHAHLVSDEPERTGFDWSLPFGARTIGETFRQRRELRLARELRTPLYTIQLFQRVGAWRRVLPRRADIVELDDAPALPHGPAAAQIRWGGAPAAKADLPPVETGWLPILMYHLVAPHVPPGFARYTVTPEAFEEQLHYLRDAGYYGITLEVWRAAMAEHKALPGKALLLTFDDAYQDFTQYAWPLLQRYGFPATMFVVTEETGGVNRWDRFLSERPQLMSWEALAKLQAEGLQLGSHSATHARLTSISPLQIVREAIRSRIHLKQKLGVIAPAIAYPYGSANSLVRHLVGACGYTFGLTCEPRRSSLWDSLLSLPRIEIRGDDSFADFVRKL